MRSENRRGGSRCRQQEAIRRQDVWIDGWMAAELTRVEDNTLPWGSAVKAKAGGRMENKRADFMVANDTRSSWKGNVLM